MRRMENTAEKVTNLQIAFTESSGATKLPQQFYGNLANSV